MQKIEYDLPIFNDEDIANLNEYSQLVANALKVQIDKFGNPLTFKGTVETLTKLQSLINMQNGDIYLVKNENKNYIYNGTEWVIYSDNTGATIDILIVEELPSENIQGRVIYLVLSDSTTEIKKYNAFVYIDDEWRKIGADIDISKLTVNLVENSYKLTLTEAVASGGTITVSSNYKVGLDRLDVYLNGEKLIKAVDSDNQGHYYEVGTQGNLSNTIRLSNDWSAKAGDVFEFTIRTNGQGVTEESLDIYSTEEQIVGKWIDGKTLYRKVINIGELIPNSRTDYSTGISNVKIKKFEAYFEALDNVFKLNHVNNYNKSSNEHESIALYTTLNGTSIRVENANVSATNLNCWVILEYTKISD